MSRFPGSFYDRATALQLVVTDAVGVPISDETAVCIVAERAACAAAAFIDVDLALSDPALARVAAQIATVTNDVVDDAEYGRLYWHAPRDCLISTALFGTAIACYAMAARLAPSMVRTLSADVMFEHLTELGMFAVSTDTIGPFTARPGWIPIPSTQLRAVGHFALQAGERNSPPSVPESLHTDGIRLIAAAVPLP